ncbi:MAG: hypothetical protein Q7J69_02630 [Candidatus Omnitrophota bacterium]|nr:hypothetical protein [Candidatus Omnitrophota bacterium]
MRSKLEKLLLEGEPRVLRAACHARKTLVTPGPLIYLPAFFDLYFPDTPFSKSPGEIIPPPERRVQNIVDLVCE